MRTLEISNFLEKESNLSYERETRLRSTNYYWNFLSGYHRTNDPLDRPEFGSLGNNGERNGNGRAPMAVIPSNSVVIPISSGIQYYF